MGRKETSVFLRALEVWLLISVAETLHGLVRISILQPVVGDFRARQIAVLTGSLIILVIAVLFRDWIPVTSRAAGAVVGAFWVTITVAFEVVIGRLVMDLPWARILEDYNLVEGGLMPLGLMVMFLAPLVALWFRNRHRPREIVDGHI